MHGIDCWEIYSNFTYNFATVVGVSILVHTQIILGGGQGAPARRLRRLERDLLLL